MIHLNSELLQAKSTTVLIINFRRYCIVIFDELLAAQLQVKQPEACISDYASQTTKLILVSKDEFQTDEGKFSFFTQLRLPFLFEFRKPAQNLSVAVCPSSLVSFKNQEMMTSSYQSKLIISMLRKEGSSVVSGKAYAS